MSYTEKELYEFMDARRPVEVTSVNGNVYTGMCWAYSSVCNAEEEGINEPSLEVQDTVLYLHEIEKISFVGDVDD